MTKMKGKEWMTQNPERNRETSTGNALGKSTRPAIGVSAVLEKVK